MNKSIFDIRSLQAIFYDFDGVMTDNRVLVDETGKEAVFVNRGDGYAIAKIKEFGIHQVIISTETNPVVERRAEKLYIPVVHGIEDKGSIVKKYCSEYGFDVRNCLFVGNDLNDLPAFGIVGYKAAPADAEKEILQLADWVAESKGGHGCIRELYRWLSMGF